ncbi:MAG: hypothetical protein IPM25_05715 [Chloracidobacterium sp.]|nr:hypothetical protein [Chloracidobacterium sp.]
MPIEKANPGNIPFTAQFSAKRTLFNLRALPSVVLSFDRRCANIVNKLQPLRRCPNRIRLKAGREQPTLPRLRPGK